jgi:transposase InsO family protein
LLSAVNRVLVNDIKRVHRDTKGRYGSPRIHVELRAQGRGASRGRIERLMRRHGIRAIMARLARGKSFNQQAIEIFLHLAASRAAGDLKQEHVV